MRVMAGWKGSTQFSPRRHQSRRKDGREGALGNPNPSGLGHGSRERLQEARAQAEANSGGGGRPAVGPETPTLPASKTGLSGPARQTALATYGWSTCGPRCGVTLATNSLSHGSRGGRDAGKERSQNPARFLSDERWGNPQRELRDF